MEDHELVGRLLSSTIEQLGYVPILARNGDEAVAFVRLKGVALVVMDLNLPDTSGLEAAQRIHQLTPDIPIILTSAWPIQIPEERLAQAGIKRFLEKPFTINEMSVALKELLDRPAPGDSSPSNRGS